MTGAWSPEARLRSLDTLNRDDLGIRVKNALDRLWINGRHPTKIVLRSEAVTYGILDDGSDDGSSSEILEMLRSAGYLASPIVRGPAQKTPSGEERPAVARLVTPRGIALQLYLTMIFESQVTRGDGSRFRNTRPLRPTDKDIGWIHLIANQGSSSTAQVTTTDNRMRQLKKGLRRLHSEGLIDLPHHARARDRFENFILLHEAGTSEYAAQPVYTNPHGGGIPIPRTFFTNLWLCCLTDSEIALWLALRYLSVRFPERHSEAGIFIPDNSRRKWFGLTRDAYEAHRALAAFGLIRRMPEPRRHANGRIKNYSAANPVEPYRFMVTDSSLEKYAPKVVPARLPHLQ